MFAVVLDDFNKYGCPNCGCDAAKAGYTGGYGIQFGTCCHCGLTFEIRDSLDIIPCIKTGVYPVNPVDPESKRVFETGYMLHPHPRTGKPKWQWAPVDDPPREGEFFRSRGAGYDLAGFVECVQAGRRLEEMCRRALGKDETKSWLDYREREPDWIQFKFSPDEFDIEKLDTLVSKDGIVTENMLMECRK